MVLPQKLGHGVSEFLTSVKAPQLLATTTQVVLADLSRGADSIPQSSQAVRAAPADWLPMRFTWLPRADVNEHAPTVPRRCDVRPQDQRLCPQTEPT